MAHARYIPRILKKYQAKTFQSLARNADFLEDISTLQGDFIGIASVDDRLVAITMNEVVTLVIDTDGSLQFLSASHIFNGVNA